MSAVNVWLSIFGMAFIATVLTRGAFLLLGNRLELSKKVRRALHYAPAAALIAIVVHSLLFDSRGTLALNIHNHHLLAAIAAGVYFWFTRQMLGMIMLGMVVFTFLRLYFS